MSTVGRGEYKCDYNLMWRMWKLSKVDVKNNAVIEVKTSQWLDRHSTMQDTLSTVLMMRPLQVKTSIKQWFEDSSEDCSSIQILVLWFQTVNKFVFLGETFSSLGPIFWKNLSILKLREKDCVAAPPIGTRVSFFKRSLLEPNSARLSPGPEGNIIYSLIPGQRSPRVFSGPG